MHDAQPRYARRLSEPAIIRVQVGPILDLSYTIFVQTEWRDRRKIQPLRLSVVDNKADEPKIDEIDKT